jgi:hypothetical protein
MMMIDEKTVEQARNADMLAFLERHCGFTFVRRGGAYRCKQHPSLAVKNDRRSWYWHSKGIGGRGALDYLMKIEQLLFREAVEAVKPGIGVAVSSPQYTAPEQPITLFLPEKAGIPLCLYDCLCCKRGIDSGIVNTLIRKETLYEDRRGNVVFVGFDGRGKPRFASVRGTYAGRVFRMDCIGSDKRYGFNMAFQPAGRLYVFESPIDAMSHASLVNAAEGDKSAWKRHSRLSLAGTSDAALPFFLNRHTDVKELVFCLDNDAPGREAAEAMARKYAEKGYDTRIERSGGKDFNKDLQACMNQIRAERRAERRAKPLRRDMDI